MSIDTVSDLPPRVQYVASAAQLDFDYTFPIFTDADLVVDVDGVTQALTTDYSVSGAGDDTGGTVTFVTPMTGGEIVTIYRDMAIERTTDFQQNGPFASASFNDELDRMTLVQQDLKARIKRALRFPMTAEVTDAEAEFSPVANWAGKFLKFDADGVPTPVSVGEGAAASTSTRQVFTATASQTTFTVAGGYTVGMLDVWQNGSKLVEAVDFIASNGTTFTLTVAATVGDSIDIIAAGIDPEAATLLPYDVRRYGADPSGVADSAAAFQTAVDALPTEGGTVTGEGDFRLDSAVTITNNRVFFDFKPGTTITVYSSNYGFYWNGTSGASPGTYGGIKGARILAGNTTPTAAVYIKNFLFMRLEGCFIYGFYTVGGGGARAGVKADYTFGTQFVGNDVRWCDYGYEIAQDTGLAYRSTSISWQAGKVGRCAKGLYLRDVYGFEINGEHLHENCSLGIHCYGDKTSGTNCANGDIRGYFEGNGKHIYLQSNTSARTIGISIENAQLETLQGPNYDDSAAFETFGTGAAGAYKVEISARVLVNGNYWSTTASTADLLINSGSTETVLGVQQRDYATLSDAGTGTMYPVSNSVGTLTTADTSPTVSGLRTCTITNAAPVTIAALDNGYSGQIVLIRALDGNTSFSHAAAGAGLRMWGAASHTLVSGQAIEFTNFGSDIWVQTGLTNPTAFTYTPTNVTPDRAYDADTVVVAELADVVGTLIADLKLRGLLQ